MSQEMRTPNKISMISQRGLTSGEGVIRGGPARRRGSVYGGEQRGTPSSDTMALRILLVLAAVSALLRPGVTQRCRSRNHAGLLETQRATASCRGPQEALVQLPVPEGFDYVTPSVVKLKQCTGLSCSFPDKCQPVAGTSNTKIYRVSAYSNKGFKADCIDVKVEEHNECRCDCENNGCPFKKKYNRNTCECECNPEERAKCRNKQKRWSEEDCSCLCSKRVECDSSMVWNPDLCKCDIRNEEN